MQGNVRLGIVFGNPGRILQPLPVLVTGIYAMMRCLQSTISVDIIATLRCTLLIVLVQVR